MKKLLIVLISILLIFTLTACGNEEVGIEDNRTLEHFVQAFRDAGYEIANVLGPFGPDPDGSIDSISFSIMQNGTEVNAVIISQFDSEEALNRFYEDGKKTFNLTKNGLFIMLAFFAKEDFDEFFIAIE